MYAVWPLVADSSSEGGFGSVRFTFFWVPVGVPPEPLPFGEKEGWRNNYEKEGNFAVFFVVFFILYFAT